MSYIIQCEGSYITKTKNGERSLTTDISRAELYVSKEKANNIINCLPKRFPQKKSCHVTEYNTTDIINNEYTEIDMGTFKSTLNDLSEQIKTMKGNNEWLHRQQSIVDQEISDILHYIEFYNFNACQGWKLAKTLKDLRLKRRSIKNQLEVLHIINTHTGGMMGAGRTSLALYNVEHKEYTPRVLKDLFQGKKEESLTS
jgi:hypothetical protein